MNTIVFAHDKELIVNKSGELYIGSPGLFYNSYESKNLIVTYSVYHGKKEEDIFRELGVEEGPLVVDSPDEFYSNTPEYSIYQLAFNSLNYKTERKTIKECLDVEEKFFYPIQIFSLEFFNSNPPLLLPTMREAIDKGLGNVLFLQSTEGYNLKERQLLWLKEFCSINNLNPSNCLYFSANLIQEKQYKEYINEYGYSDYIKFIPDYHFENTPWFTPGHLHYNSEHNLKVLNIKLQYNRQGLIENYFLCLSRRPHYHRVLLYLYMSLFEEIDKKSIKSLGREPNTQMWNHYILMVQNSNDFYLEKQKLLDAITTHNHTEDVSVDIDSAINQAHSINFELHNKSFINIVTETSVSKNSLFFSEKIFKPIYLCQPFILLGNPHSLKKLQDMGYQTFNKWWDESYDQEENEYIRIQMIIEVMRKISLWPMFYMKHVLLEMEPVLKNNFNIFINEGRFTEQLSHIKCK